MACRSQSLTPLRRQALSRYNCEEQYSHWNCADCRKAYARWACAMTMPACTASPCAVKKPCVRVCNEVVQKCPVTLGFSYPDDNRDYKASGCNLMGLKSGERILLLAGLVSVVWHRPSPPLPLLRCLTLGGAGGLRDGPNPGRVGLQLIGVRGVPWLGFHEVLQVLQYS